MEAWSPKDTVAPRIFSVSVLAFVVFYALNPYYTFLLHGIVDSHKESGQSLFRQYVGKKGKIVLSANWVLECIKAGALQTYANNFAGCKVTGTETYATDIIVSMNRN